MIPAREELLEIQVIEHSDPRFSQAAAVRRQVFIEEQNVPENEEWDEVDIEASHLLALVDGRVVGTLRFHADGDWLHVGRVSVLPECRGMDVGRQLMLTCLGEALNRGFSRSYLHSQTDKAGFYRKFGYREKGGEFMESGISHVRMELFF